MLETQQIARNFRFVSFLAPILGFLSLFVPPALLSLRRFRNQFAIQTSRDMPGVTVNVEAGITAVPKEAQQAEGSASLRMPDGQVIELPVLLDSNGAKFVDIRKLQPR